MSALTLACYPETRVIVKIRFDATRCVVNSRYLLLHVRKNLNVFSDHTISFPFMFQIAFNPLNCTSLVIRFDRYDDCILDTTNTRSRIKTLRIELKIHMSRLQKYQVTLALLCIPRHAILS